MLHLEIVVDQTATGYCISVGDYETGIYHKIHNNMRNWGNVKEEARFDAEQFDCLIRYALNDTDENEERLENMGL